MECKVACLHLMFLRRVDLIDTLWNVKLVTERAGFRPAADLIDTLWNVKLSVVFLFLFHSRFNRYIVECKVSTLALYICDFRAI